MEVTRFDLSVWLPPHRCLTAQPVLLGPGLGPHRCHAASATPAPLGLGPCPEPLRLRLALGDRILLYTDGVSEARAGGGFFPLQAAAAFALVSADLQAGLGSLWAELQRHVAGHLHDDVALLLIERSS
jgi:hypothetical protein